MLTGRSAYSHVLAQAQKNAGGRSGAKQLFAAAAHEDRGAPILLMLGTGYDLSSPPAGPASKTGGVGGEAIKDAAGNAEQIAAVRQRFERLKAIKKRPVHPWYHLSPIDLYRALVVVPIIGVLASIFLDWHKWYLVCAGLFLIGVGFWLFVRIAFVSDDIRGARSNRSGRAFLLGLGILIAFSVAGVLIMPWREP